MYPTSNVRIVEPHDAPLSSLTLRDGLWVRTEVLCRVWRCRWPDHNRVTTKEQGART